MDVFELFGTDPQKELHGSEVELAPGVTITVARANNRRFDRLIVKRVQEDAGKFKTDAIDGPEREAADAHSDELLAEVMADTILLGWQGIKYKGEEIEYSKENAKMMLMHRDFRDFVETHARNIDNFKAKDEAEVEKNS